MSKFREDLPELPMSPPDSRLQSPEAVVALPPHPDPTTSGAPGGVGSSHAPEEGPSQEEPRRSAEMQSPTSTASRAIVGQSLASVDSEGSWLSGKPSKRSSQLLTQAPRESSQSLAQKMPDFGSPEEDDVTEDPFLSRLSPEPDERRDSTSAARKASSGVLSGDSEGESEAPPLPRSSEGEGTWHSGVARRPTLVKQRNQKKSAEGLLNQFQEGEEAVATDVESPLGAEEGPESPGDEVKVHRATSVDLGKRHARHISAGSAKLLHVPGRRSTESKRLSQSSAEPSPSRKTFSGEVTEEAK